jgi:hypothetical protein
MSDWEVAKVTKKKTGVRCTVDGVTVLIPWIAARTIARMVEDEQMKQLADDIRAIAEGKDNA